MPVPQGAGMRYLAIALLLSLPLPARAARYCDAPEYVKPLVEMMLSGEFEKLDGQLTHLALVHEKGPDGMRKLIRALDELSKVVNRDPTLQAKLNQWSHALPRSHYPYTVRGRVWQRQAVLLRGDGRQAVKNEGLRHGALLILDKAREQLEKAHELRPWAVDPLVFLIAVRVVDDSPIEVRKQVFDSVLERDPTSLMAHALMLEGYMARLGGSHEAMFRFARESVAAHPDAPELKHLIVRAHAEMARIWGDETEYYAAPEIWSEVRSAYEEMATAEEHSLWAYNHLASLAFQVGRPASAKRALDHVGDAWDACAWHSSYDRFERARIWAMRNEANEIDYAPPAELSL